MKHCNLTPVNKSQTQWVIIAMLLILNDTVESAYSQ